MSFVIGRARRIFDEAHSSYIDEKTGKDKSGSLKGTIEEGYVELLGVTDPESVGNIVYSEADPFSPVLYEYVWSVGVKGPHKWCEKLDEDDSIVIQLIFHTKNSRFSIRDVAADLKQLPPFQKEKKIFDWLDTLRPALDTVGKGLEATGFGFPGKIISTISQMKLNSVSTQEFPWWTKTLCSDNNPGIEWHISKSYLESVGGRFIGTLGVYFLDCGSDNKELDETLLIEIKAFLRGPERRGGSDELYISNTAKNKETILVINPKPFKKN